MHITSISIKSLIYIHTVPQSGKERESKKKEKLEKERINNHISTN